MQRVRPLLGVEFSGDLGCPGVAPDDEPCNSSETLLHVGSGFGKQEVVPGGLPEVDSTKCLRAKKPR
jgi:hypothetical protein